MKRILVLATCLAAAAAETSAHMQPYLSFVLRFEDAQGRPASGLSVLVETLEATGEADIREGTALVPVEFPRDYDGPLRIRIFDRKRRPVALAGDTVPLLAVREYRYRHRAGWPLKSPSEAADPFDQGREFFGSDGRAMRTDPGRHGLPGFRLAWDPDTLSAGDREAGRKAEVLDREIAAELARNLEAVRQGR